MTICPNERCRSTRVIWQGKKYKCLDCHRTFKYENMNKGVTKDDVIKMKALLRMATGIHMMRDFKESDIVKEE